MLQAVVDRLDLQRFDLLGISLGAPASIAYAARFPERVDRLILYGGYADGRQIASPGVRAAMLDLIRAHWGLGSTVLADIFLPEGTTASKALFAAATRGGIGPVRRRRARPVLRDRRVELLPQVAVPTLVLHRRDDRAIRAGRDLAAQIPGARLVSLPGRSHFPYVGDAATVVRAILEFLGNAPAAPRMAGGPTSGAADRAAAAGGGAGRRRHDQSSDRRAAGHRGALRRGTRRAHPFPAGRHLRAQVAAWWARRVSGG